MAMYIYIQFGTSIFLKKHIIWSFGNYWGSDQVVFSKQRNFKKSKIRPHIVGLGVFGFLLP